MTLRFQDCSFPAVWQAELSATFAAETSSESSMMPRISASRKTVSLRGIFAANHDSRFFPSGSGHAWISAYQTALKTLRLQRVARVRFRD